MRVRSVTLAGAVLTAATLAAQSYPPAFPRPNATKLIENEQIVVWRMVWPKGQPTQMHRHVHDQVGTYYAAGGRVITNLDGSKRDAMTPVGNLSTTKKGTTHIEEGTTDPPLRAVFVELLHDGPAGPLDTSSSVPPLFPREGTAKPLDDERVTVWDYTWRAGSATTPVRYPRNALTVWLGAGSVRVTGADGKHRVSGCRAGRDTLRGIWNRRAHRDRVGESTRHGLRVQVAARTVADRHILPFGGLRPTPGRIHPLVDYLLDLTGKPRARVAFLPTAMGDSPEALVNMYARFPAERTERSHLALFHRTVDDVERYLLNQDIIVVSGGNTANMLAIWRVHGVDAALRAAWEEGVILTGGSAGSLCWFECGTTDSFNLYRLAALHDGLGFLPGSHCPHYDGEAQRRPLYHQLIREGFPAGYAIDEDAAVHFVGREAAEVVTGRSGATAYRVERVGEEAVETPLEARLLAGAT